VVGEPFFHCKATAAVTEAELLEVVAVAVQAVLAVAWLLRFLAVLVE
jgi:hypothetical protein